MGPDFSNHINFYKHEIPPYRCFLITPVGSWNYNCADKYSDIDTKAIFVPSINDVIQNKCESYSYIFPNKEHIDFCDIRNYMKSLIKGNPQFLETLFTKWWYFNNESYGEEIHTLIHMREVIARCNPNNTMRAFLGMAERNYKLCISRSEEDHLGKWVYQLVRIEECMDKYGQGRSFKECLTTSKREFLLSLKNNEYSKEVLLATAEEYIARCHNHNETFIFMNYKEDKIVQYGIEKIITQVFRKSIEEGKDI